MVWSNYEAESMEMDHGTLPLRLDQVQVGHMYKWETSEHDKELINHKRRK